MATALRLFMAHGYDQTTVEAIIGEIGVAKGCFYHHFRSKEELFAACAAAAARGLTTDYLEILEDPSVPPGQRLVRFLDHSYRLAEQADGLLGRPLPAAVSQVDREVTQLVGADLLPAVTRLIDDGVRRGEFGCEDAEMTAAAVLGALANVHDCHAGSPGLDLPAHRRKVIALLARMLDAAPGLGGDSDA